LVRGDGFGREHSPPKRKQYWLARSFARRCTSRALDKYDDAREREKDSKQPALVRDFKSLTLDRALDVWDKMTPEEKKLSQAALETKAVNQPKAGKQLP